MDNLTPKQQAFCREYVIDSNGRQAAIRAGYAPNSAQEQSSRLLSKSKVQAYVQELRSELEQQGLWQREQSVKALIDIVNNPERCSDIVQAVRELNRMHGYDAPVKVESTLSISFFADDERI